MSDRKEDEGVELQVRDSGPGPRTSLEDSLSKKASFGSQLWLLFWKNMLVKWNSPCSTFTEIFGPVIVGLLLVLLRSAEDYKPKIQASQLNDQYGPLNATIGRYGNLSTTSPTLADFGIGAGEISFSCVSSIVANFQQGSSNLTISEVYPVSCPTLHFNGSTASLSPVPVFPARCDPIFLNYGLGGRLAVIPDNKITRAFAGFLSSSSGAWGSCLSQNLIDNILFLQDESALSSIVADANYVDGSIAAAVAFESFSPNWKYRIRVPISSVPATNSYRSNYNAAFGTLNYIPQYVLNSGFAPLQALVDEYIMLVESGRTAPGPGQFYQVYASSFPTPSYIKDDFWLILQQRAVLFFLLVYLWPFTRMVKSIVEERTLRITEGLKMMGVSDAAIWLSWFMTYLVIFLFSDIILAAIFKINMYNYTTFGMLFLYLFSFSLSIISLGFLFTVLFKSARTAIQLAIVGFIAGYVIYVLGGGEDGATRASTLGVCIFSPACFCVTIYISGQLELAGLGASISTFNTVIANGVSFGTTIGFFYLDCVIYLLLTWYLGNIIPSEYGVTRPWWFVFDRNYWFAAYPKPKSEDYKAVKDENDFQNLHTSGLYEQVGVEVSKQDGVKIRKLHKEFTGGFGSTPFVAVQSVDLDMFEGEVFALLGHNGAGKTTTISMLTGLIPISSGDAKVFGRSVKRDLDRVQSIIGVCPQQNVLFDNLTVAQHLEFFAGLRGVPKSEIRSTVKTIIEDVGLTEKVHAKARTLSGGQKRKLCVAMAFIGSPKVVFLDEPTSGMDVNSRRSTWDLIKKYKKNRVIVLTTHFMDEADLLADRIAIMAKGAVVCCGSSLFLKSKYGVGYTLIINKKEGSAASDSIRQFLDENLQTHEIVHDIGTELFARVPLNASSRFPALFKQIESRKGELGIVNYGISVTTLEEVFLKVGESSTGTVEDVAAETKRRDSIEAKVGSEEEKDNEILKIMKMSAVRDNQNSFVVFLRHFWALVVKRAQYLKRDKGSIFCLTALPALILIAGLGSVSSFTFVSTTELQFNIEQYSKVIPISSAGSTILNSSYLPLDITTIPVGVDFLQDSNAFTNFSAALYSLSQHNPNSLFGAFVDVSALESNSGAPFFRFFIYANQTGLHAIPAYLNVLSNAALHYLTNSSLSITASSFPLPQSLTERKSNQRVSGLITAFFSNQALIFVPATFIVLIVTEKQSKAKHQQLISGVSIPAYWLSNYLFDFLCYLPLWVLCTIILKFNFIPQLATGSAYNAAVVLFLLNGWVYIPFSYFLAFFFENPLTARILTIVIAYIIGPILTIISSTLDGLSSTTSLNTKLMYIWRIFPGFNVGYGVYQLATNPLGLDGFDQSIAGKSIIALAWEGPVYILVVIIVEYLLSVPRIAKMIRKLLRLERNVPLEPEQEDDDVVAEKNRVQSGQAHDDIIQVKGIRKVYGGKKVAVKDLWYGIPKGECFGFLGINGAGKTTTLEILSGDIFPTEGTALLGGFDILSNQLAVRRLIGYCPQFDALFSLLTAREHLEFYGKLKGVEQSKMKQIVDGMLRYLSLEEYADKPAGTYSGGNKRKLSVAMSLIGDPPIVFLDEPSSGMDPVSRRFMWKFIAETMQGRAVILTTHSMDECEALCQRIGIMVGGRLQCLGNAQHLKNKFGSGYQLDVNGQSGEELLTGIKELFPEARLLERHDAVMKFQLPGGGDLATIFESLETHKDRLQIKEYSVSQTSLEMIFIRFAKEQDEEKGVAEGFKDAEGLVSK